MNKFEKDHWELLDRMRELEAQKAIVEARYIKCKKDLEAIRDEFKGFRADVEDELWRMWDGVKKYDDVIPF